MFRELKFRRFQFLLIFIFSTSFIISGKTNGVFIENYKDLKLELITDELEIPWGRDFLDNGDIFAPWCNTFVFNLTQQPASSVPCGRTSAGLPVGLQIVGRPHDDVGVLRIAKAFENTETFKVTIPLD